MSGFRSNFNLKGRKRSWKKIATTLLAVFILMAGLCLSVVSCGSSGGGGGGGAAAPGTEDTGTVSGSGE